MARPLRLEFAGALYYVTSRDDRREDIYETDEDRENYLSILGAVCETYHWHFHAYCLMTNHYRLSPIRGHALSFALAKIGLTLECRSAK